MELEVVVADGTAKVSEPTEDQSLLNARAGGGGEEGEGVSRREGSSQGDSSSAFLPLTAERAGAAPACSWCVWAKSRC